MESKKFDDITRALATGTTRRGVLKGMVGSAVGGALGMLGLSRGAAQPADKVSICHREGNGSFHVIEVSANALPAHEAHGDLVSCPEDFELNLETCTCECALVCEAPFVLDEESCSCVCGLTCEAPFVLDEASCSCVCDLACEAPFILDEARCSCVCGLTDDACPNLEIVDPDACACFCPVDQITCPDGQTLNPDTCSCEAGPDPECAGAVCEVLQNCNERTDCFCFNTSEGGGFCAVSVSCSQLSGCPNGQSDCAAGELCLVDTCCIDPVCKPVSFGCAQPEGLRVQSQPAIVDDGPTTGGQ